MEREKSGVDGAWNAASHTLAHRPQTAQGMMAGAGKRWSRLPPEELDPRPDWIVARARAQLERDRVDITVKVVQAAVS